MKFHFAEVPRSLVSKETCWCVQVNQIKCKTVWTFVWSAQDILILLDIYSTVLLFTESWQSYGRRARQAPARCRWLCGLPSWSAWRSVRKIFEHEKIFELYLQGGTASGKSTVCKRLMETLGQTDKSDVEKKVDIIYNIYIPIIDSIIDISTFI